MASVKLTDRAVSDLERIFEFVATADPQRALAVVEDIEDALQVLTRHPLIGRGVEDGRRELVISHGRRTYIALYRWFEVDSHVLVLAIRSAREAGYAD